MYSSVRAYHNMSGFMEAMSIARDLATSDMEAGEVKVYDEQETETYLNGGKSWDE